MRDNISASVVSSRLYDVYSIYYQMFSSIVPSCTRHTQNTAYLGYSLSVGNKGTYAIHFRDLPYFTASLKISIFICSYLTNAVTLFICFIATANFEAGTTTSPAATAVRFPSWYFFCT